MYTEDLRPRINTISETIIFPDENSFMVSGKIVGDFLTVLNV
jgi:hypothetical protein